MMMSNGTMLNLTSTFVGGKGTTNTKPEGSVWQMLPIPMTRGGPGLGDIGYQFPPPCYEPIAPGVLTQGTCAGEWISNITMYDSLKVPVVKPGEWVLGFRWDCESSAQ
jgi:hypothetical protein